jgi:hypothetical protein
MRFSNLCEQDPAPNPRVNLRHTFDRIRAFVTFGSPLEKTKYFFDVTNPSPSAAQEQWRNDAYGPLFTADARCLDGPNGATRGMYWGNYWYFKDAIANELLSFASFVGLGASASQGHHIRHLLAVAVRHGRIAVGPDEALAGRRVCRNEQGHKGFVVPAILPHGEYLGDQGWFWRTDTAAEHLGVLDIVARTTGAPYAPAETCYTTPWGATYRVVAAAERARISDQYSVPPLGADVPSNPDAPAERDENDAGTHADDRGHAHVLAVAEYDGDHRAKKTTTDSR